MRDEPSRSWLAVSAVRNSAKVTAENFDFWHLFDLILREGSWTEISYYTPAPVLKQAVNRQPGLPPGGTCRAGLTDFSTPTVPFIALKSSFGPISVRFCTFGHPKLALLWVSFKKRAVWRLPPPKFNSKAHRQICDLFRKLLYLLKFRRNLVASQSTARSSRTGVF